MFCYRAAAVSSMMFVEPLVQRLCAACVLRNLLSTRQTGLHRLLSTNSLHQRKNTQEPDNNRLHHRSFMTSCGWQNKPKDEFDIAKNPFFDKYQEKLKHLREYDISFLFNPSPASHYFFHLFSHLHIFLGSLYSRLTLSLSNVAICY